MANGTLKVSNIETSSGSGTITIGQSGETVALGSGASQTLAANTPAFYGELASTQTISRNSYVKVTGMTNNEVDSDSAFDGTTFTVPSGEGGKYFIYGTAQVDFEIAGDDGEEARAIIYKNGSEIKTAKFRNQSTKDLRYVNLNASVIIDLSATDTIELYTYSKDNSGADARVLSRDTSIGGYKLIGV